MSKKIYLYSEDKKYKCAVELADTFDKFGCPDHSMIILTEERPNGIYVISEARDRVLVTEKDKKIVDLQHRLDVAEKALELACDYLVSVADDNDELHKLVKDIFDGDKYLKTKINYFELKAEKEINKRSNNDER